MKHYKKRSLALLFCAFALALSAEDISVSNASIRQTPPHAKNTAVFLTLTNHSDKDIALIRAKSSLSTVTELHEHRIENQKMVMAPIPKITIKSHSSTELKSGGLHIMLLDLKESINEDSKADLTLYFDNGASLELNDIPAVQVEHKHH